MNISTEFSFIPHIASDELIFEYCCMTTNQIVRFEYMFGRGPLNKHF